METRQSRSYLDQNKIVNNRDPNYNIRKLVTGLSPNKMLSNSATGYAALGGLYNSRNAPLAAAKTSEVDILRSTLYSSSIAATAYNTTSTKGPATAGSKRITFTNSRDNQTKEGLQLHRSSDNLQLGLLTHANFFTGHTSSLKDPQRVSRIKTRTFYRSQKLDKLDPSHQNPVMEEFNIKLANDQNPRPLLENPQNQQNQLTLMAKRNQQNTA